MSQRARVVTLIVVVVVIIGLAAAYVARSASRDETTSGRPAPEQVSAARIESQPRIVFRNTATGPALRPRRDGRARRPVGSAGRHRHRVRPRGRGPGHDPLREGSTGVTSAYSVTAERGSDRLLRVERPGIPSRARLSPQGTVAATTAFIAGDSYLSAGFSTRTFITPLATGRAQHVENYTLVHRGKRIAPIERNYWGVTFVDEDAFYLTVSFGGDTWLARGSVRDRRVETIRKTAECPSVSPDHTRVAYKVRQSSGGWRIAILDLASGRETLLAEKRSVDDQVEWLDDDTVLYALPLTGARSGESDVWAMAADGSGRPRRLIEQAASPSVVR